MLLLTIWLRAVWRRQRDVIFTMTAMTTIMAAIANCIADDHSLKQRLSLDDGKYNITVQRVHHEYHLPGKIVVATETVQKQ